MYKQKIKLSEMIAPSFYDLAHDVLKHKHTHYDLSGGRGSLKSSTISLLIPVLMMDKNNADIHALVLRKVGNTLRDSVYDQYIWAINKLGVAHWWKVKVSPLELIYKPTGQKIMFRGLDDPTKTKSIKPPFGYFGITHFEEKDQFFGRKEIRTVLESTMRGKSELTDSSRFWNFESYNPPISRDNWANLDSLEERADRLTHKSTYLQAPPEWLGEQFLLEAEYLKETNEREYRHEYLGEAIGTGGNVFENIVDEPITDEQIKNFDRIYNGVDWGYYPDPWAFNQVYYNAAQRIVYIYGELTENKKSNTETAEMLKKYGLSNHDVVMADSAEPKSIGDYRRAGINCYGVKKGAGSVDYSTKWLQSCSKIIIDKRRCKKTFEEFVKYEYERTKDGEIISGYPDRDNHHIDAVRYALEPMWRRGENGSTKKYKSIL